MRDPGTMMPASARLRRGGRGEAGDVSRGESNPGRSFPRVPEAFHLGVLALAPWWYGGYPDPARYGSAALLLAVTAAWLWRHPAIERRVALPVLALGTWPIAQILFGVTSSAVLAIESAIVLSASLAVFAFWATEARQESAARRLAVTVVSVCLLQATFGIVQHAANPQALYGTVLPFLTSPFGSYHNHSHFAGLVEMGALLAVGLALGRARRLGEVDPRTVIAIGVSLALAGAVVASGSRGGLLALAGGAVVLGPLWRLAHKGHARAWRSLSIAALLGVLLVGFGWTIAPPSTRAHLATVLGGAADGSGRARVAAYRATLALWRAHAVAGSGLGGFMDSLGGFRTSDGSVRIMHVESDVLEFAAEAGVVGLVLLAWLAVAGLRGFRERLTEGHDPFRKGMAVGAMAAVAALFFHAFLDFNLRIPANALVFAALAGLAASARRPGPVLPAAACRALAVMAATLALAASWRVVGSLEYPRAAAVEGPNARLAAFSRLVHRHPYLADGWLERSYVWSALAQEGPAMGQLRLEHALADLHACLRLRPSWSDAWVQMGWTRLAAGDRSGARAAFERASALDPARTSIGLACADFFSRVGEPDRVLRELVRIRRYNADWPLTSVIDAARRFGLNQARIEILTSTPPIR
jgi:O-antigen ligase